MDGHIVFLYYFKYFEPKEHFSRPVACLNETYLLSGTFPEDTKQECHHYRWIDSCRQHSVP